MAISDVEFDRIAHLLRKGSSAHKKLARQLAQMRDMSRREMSQFYSDWDDQESRVKYYVSSDYGERREATTTAAGKKKKNRRIVIPFSFLSLMVKMAMLMAIYYNDDPHVRLRHRGEEDFLAARLMEALLDAQGAEMQRWIKDYQWFKDAKTYGVGIMYAHWEERFGQMARRITAPDGSIITTILEDEVLTYQGNECMNIDPYSFRPDPYRSLGNIEGGTFCGHYVEESLEMLKDLGEMGVLFNTEHLTAIRSSQNSQPQDRADRNRTSGGTTRGNLYVDDLRTQVATGRGTDNDPQKSPYVGLTHIYWRVRPSDYKLSDVSRLQMWHFILSDDGHIVCAEPAEYDKFPYFVLQPYGDLYTRASPSESGFLAEVEDFATFLMSTRKQGVQRNLGDGIVYDPTSIKEEDISRGEFGMRIKYRRRTGTTIDQVFRQLQFTDSTVGHIQDIQFMLTIFEYITGVSSTMLGAVSGSSRNTATEVRGATRLATQRVQLEASLFSNQGYAGINKFFIMQNMNRLSIDQFIKITGDWGKMLLEEGQAIGTIVQVPPRQLLGNMDLESFDGSFPADPLSQADSLERMIGLSLQTPLAAEADWANDNGSLRRAYRPRPSRGSISSRRRCRAEFPPRLRRWPMNRLRRKKKRVTLLQCNERSAGRKEKTCHQFPGV